VEDVRCAFGITKKQAEEYLAFALGEGKLRMSGAYVIHHPHFKGKPPSEIPGTQAWLSQKAQGGACP